MTPQLWWHTVSAVGSCPRTRSALLSSDMWRYPVCTVHHQLRSLLQVATIGKGNKPDVSLDPYQRQATDLAMAGHNLFITGAAGTGKSATLRAVIKALTTKRSQVEVFLGAMTGVAATHIGGATLHRLLGVRVPEYVHSFKRHLKLGNYKRRSITKTQHSDVQLHNVDSGVLCNTMFATNMDPSLPEAVLIIDEVSMLSAEFFELMVYHLSHKCDVSFVPSPGKSWLQLIMVGDFHQLPPIPNTFPEAYLHKCSGKKKHDIFLNRGYAFEAPAWQYLNMKTVELLEVHRQANKSFSSQLARLRSHNHKERDLAMEALVKLCSRPLTSSPLESTKPVYLFSTNKKADELNNQELEKLNGRTRQFESVKDVLITRIYPVSNLRRLGLVVHHRLDGSICLAFGDCPRGEHHHHAVFEDDEEEVDDEDDDADEDEDEDESHESGRKGRPAPRRAKKWLPLHSVLKAVEMLMDTRRHSRNRDRSMDSKLEGLYEELEEMRDEASARLECRHNKQLELKVGAQVMLTKNIDVSKGLVNGAVGTVVEFTPQPPLTHLSYVADMYLQYPYLQEEHAQRWSEHNTHVPVVAFNCGVKQVVLPTAMREHLPYHADIFDITVPLILCWAITIHKSQGTTLPQVIADLTPPWAAHMSPGQVYVALSRAQSIEGLQIKGYQWGSCRVSQAVCRFYDAVHQGRKWTEHMTTHNWEPKLVWDSHDLSRSSDAAAAWYQKHRAAHPAVPLDDPAEKPLSLKDMIDHDGLQYLDSFRKARRTTQRHIRT